MKIGDSLADFLTQHNVDVDTFVDELVQRADARLNVLVADDLMTSERAAQILDAVRAGIEDNLQNSLMPGVGTPMI